MFGLDATVAMVRRKMFLVAAESIVCLWALLPSSVGSRLGRWRF